MRNALSVLFVCVREAAALVFGVTSICMLTLIAAAAMGAL